jgi:hypothetical protein
MLERLKERAPDDPQQRDTRWLLTLRDLAVSGIPLDRPHRFLIAEQLNRFAYPDKQRKRAERTAKRRNEIAHIQWCKDVLTNRGMAPGEAEEAVAKAMNSTVENLRKKVTRARRDFRDKKSKICP